MPPHRTIVPIVAVPIDGAGWNGDYPTALDAAIDTALAWWGRQLGERPFDALPATAIGLREPRAAYSAQPDTQEMLRRELAEYYSELAGTGELGLVYVVYACLSDDPYRCPGNVIGTSAAAWGGPPCLVVQSSGSLDAFALGRNPLDPTSGSREAQTGALAHELGHCLSLPHPSDPAVQALSVMWSWWTFPRCGLSDAEQHQAAAYARQWAGERVG